MKTINLKGISEILSEKELKQIVGGNCPQVAIGCISIGACGGSTTCDVSIV
jgi:natural product precursor